MTRDQRKGGQEGRPRNSFSPQGILLTLTVVLLSQKQLKMFLGPTEIAFPNKPMAISMSRAHNKGIATRSTTFSELQNFYKHHGTSRDIVTIIRWQNVPPL